MKKVLFITFISLILISCAVTGPSFTLNKPMSKDKALVYLYRPTTYIDSLNPLVAVLALDNKEVGPILINGHYAFELTPGEHVFEVRNLPKDNRDNRDFIRLSLAVTAGSTSYVQFKTIDERVTIGYRTGTRLTYSLKQIRTKEAIEEIKDTRLLTH